MTMARGTGAQANDLRISIIGGSDAISVKNHFLSTAGVRADGLSRITFSDGVFWDRLAIDANTAGGLPPNTPTEGNDTLAGTIGNDVIDALGGNDVVSGDAGDDQLMGGLGSDQLNGNAGNDTLIGGAGTDTTVGGLGNDTHVIDAASDVTTEAAAEGTDTVQSPITWTLGANFENLTLTGAATINGTGNTLNNTLTGNSAANRLDGGAGIDTMQGGAGNDIYVVNDTADVVSEGASAGTDGVEASVSFTLGTNVENIVLTGSASINATGNTSNNTLTGNAGANLLNGGAGADTMVGGAGNDIYVVDNAGDVVTEGASAGTDTVESSITYTLGANLENLTLTGSSAINATGNTLANTLTGNAAANSLNGGTGADTMAGGLGNDVYVVDNASDIVNEAASAGTDRVDSSITYTLAANVENLTLTGTAAINGTGNTLNNSLTGNSGNNRLDGGAGADTMAGGAGDDIYVVDNATDIVTEAASAGTDRVDSSVTYTLGTNVENLTLPEPRRSTPPATP